MINILLIGAGYMAKEYYKTIEVHGFSARVIGRGIESAKSFEKEFNCEVFRGGLETFISGNTEIFTHAIVASNIECLNDNVLSLLKSGVKNILVEKPGALTLKELNSILDISDNLEAKIFIAYNRRFFQSVSYAKQIIKQDDGIKSIHFEFTEWIDNIHDVGYHPSILENLVLANSSHVIDTVFHFAGQPISLNSIVAGRSFLDWHKAGAIFCGSGMFQNHIPFSYHANWIAPGRWGIEILTKKHRLFLKPMEKLHIQKINSVKIELVEKDYNLDIIYKPGIYELLKSFFNDTTDPRLCSLGEHIDNFPYYKQMAGYNGD